MRGDRQLRARARQDVTEAQGPRGTEGHTGGREEETARHSQKTDIDARGDKLQTDLPAVDTYRTQLKPQGSPAREAAMGGKESTA